MDYTLLSKSPVFAGFLPEEIKIILKAVPHHVKKYNNGYLISQCGETVNSLMIVTEGSVKGEMVDFTGKVIKIEDIPAPGSLASAFIFGKNNRLPVNVVTMSETELLVIERSDLLKLLMSNDRILINFLNMISNRSQFLSEKIKFLSFKTIKGKLANYIIQKSAGMRSEILLDKSQNELAELFGVTRPSVARAIGELEEEGFIVAKGKRIKIADKNGLADITRD